MIAYSAYHFDDGPNRRTHFTAHDAIEMELSRWPWPLLRERWGELISVQAFVDGALHEEKGFPICQWVEDRRPDWKEKVFP